MNRPRPRAWDVDAEVAAIAATQFGAISRRQALYAGLTANQIAYRVQCGRWRCPIPGVYILAGVPESPEQNAMVALLASPDGSVLSHLSAAAVYELGAPPPVPHLIVPWTASGRFRNAVVHRSRQPLDPRDRRQLGPFLCTSPARTLVDCAALVGYEAFCEMLDRALCRGLATADSVRAAAGRASAAKGRKGQFTLERALEVWVPGPRPHSVREMEMVRLLTRWGLPMPERQMVIRDERGRFIAKVDLGWRRERIAFEYDGAEFHTPRTAAADARRQGRIEAQGYRVIRVRKEDVGALRARLTALFTTHRAA
ncbi:MAG: DUF559 domain-containing protein [Acidimicrobiia bacterium]